ncbi:hypothetical protein ACIRSS_07945 [Amycolatopsis sp. NPDC101161]|uniref:hypothetical protein n=1 Tax=Amycolatopsis sp. NPDC101161 TaxID=3363940 RepID=UPI0037F46E97
MALAAVSTPACGTPPLVQLTRITVYTTVLTGSGPPVPVPLTRIVAIKRFGPGICDGTSQ